MNTFDRAVELAKLGVRSETEFEELVDGLEDRVQKAMSEFQGTGYQLSALQDYAAVRILSAVSSVAKNSGPEGLPLVTAEIRRIEDLFLSGWQPTNDPDIVSRDAPMRDIPLLLELGPALAGVHFPGEVIVEKRKRNKTGAARLDDAEGITASREAIERIIAGEQANKDRSPSR